MYINGDNFGFHFNMLLKERTLAFWNLTDSGYFPWVKCFEVVRLKRQLIEVVFPMELKQELMANYEQALRCKENPARRAESKN
jgi:hypothetical protein